MCPRDVWCITHWCMRAKDVTVNTLSAIKPLSQYALVKSDSSGRDTTRRAVLFLFREKGMMPLITYTNHIKGNVSDR